LDRPTDDSIEVAVGFMREVGLFLSENSPKANNTVFERFRAVLHEGAISKRCQYMIEVLFQVRKDKYKDNPSVPEGLDLVEEEEQITHKITLDDELQVQESLSESTYLVGSPVQVKTFADYSKTCSRWTQTSWRTRRDTTRSSAKFWVIPKTRRSLAVNTSRTRMRMRKTPSRPKRRESRI
jgi:hypothetical protein